MHDNVVHIRDSVIPDLSVGFKEIYLSSEEDGVVFSNYNLNTSFGDNGSYVSELDFKTIIDYNEFLEAETVPITMRKFLLYQQLRAS